MFSAVLRMLTRIKISKTTVTDRPIPWCRAPLRSLPPSLGEPACSPPSGLCSPEPHRTPHVVEADQPAPPALGRRAATLLGQPRSLRATAPSSRLARLSRSLGAWRHPPAGPRRRCAASAVASRPCCGLVHAPQANAAIPPPPLGGLASTRSGHPPVSVPAASFPDHLPGAFGDVCSRLSAATRFSPLVLKATGSSHGTVSLALRAAAPPASRSCRRRRRPRLPPSSPRWTPRPLPEAPNHAPWGSSRRDLILTHRSLVSPGVASPAGSRVSSRSSQAALPVVLLDRLPRTQESHNSLNWCPRQRPCRRHSRLDDF
jgi:hypothetical protein